MRNGVRLLLLVAAMCLGAGVGATEWTHAVQLSPNYTLHWRPNESSVSFKIEARTLGFVGLGFSPKGGMANADIILLWVDDYTGEAHVGDYYATGNAKPRRDEIQNVELLEAEQNGTHTIVKFRREWETCDQLHDMALGEETVRLIWALGQKDPANGHDPSVWHGKQMRGTKSVYLKTASLQKKKKRANHQKPVRFWDVKMSNLLIPDNMDTRYWCKIFKLPYLDKKHHMIGYSPLIDPRNKGSVHHMILYECVHSRAHSMFARYIAHEGAACYSPKMPSDWEHCLTPIVTWAIGSEGELLPEHVGLPLSYTDYPSDTYFMLEVHYDNPTFKNARDNSGIRVHFTEELREYDGGVMTVGTTITPLHMIPPRQESYATAGYCSDECTSQMLPDTGIKVVSVVLHAHLAGRAMTLRHIRNGKELAPIVKDSHYDFNYQQARVLSNEVQIEQGDELIMECGYQTINRTEPTFGGYSTKEEMCLAFVLYYPQTSLAGCYSMTPVESFFSILGVSEFYDMDMAKIKKMLLHNDKDSRPKPLVDTPPAPGTPFPDSPLGGGHINDEANQKAIQALLNMKEFTIEPVDGAVDAAGILDGLRIRLPYEFQNRTILDHLQALSWTDKLLARKVEDAFYHGQHLIFCRRKDDSLAFLPKVQTLPNITHPHQTLEKSNCPVRRGAQLGMYSPNNANSLKTTIGVPLTITMIHILSKLH
ncbi:Hypothetical predicted protein [Cloeon dipterum]|uniref:DOMON domain-containing protein n=2 Tax=Cloeon dipterum TaxID=197152 RepID=A0A8S1DL64_9INSE|nr:Hypothetical predicted protein [Cloeon dipterum]